MIQINIGNKVFYSLLIILGVLALGVGVFAAHGGLPQGQGHITNPGHPLECITGGYKQGVGDFIESPSTTGEIYNNFGDVFTRLGTNPPEVFCNDGWAMTGCASATVGTGADNDEKMFSNSCRGDSTPDNDNWIYARCCRVVG